MKKIVVAGIAVIAALVLVGSGQWPFPNFGTTDSGTPESITIGTPPFESSALVFVANDTGLFTENGLNVTLKIYNTSLQAINCMENYEVNASVSAEYPIVAEIFKKKNISVIGNINKLQTVYLIGRKDRGIENVSDLRGKKIGFPRGTILEFYLGRFLDLNGMSLQDATLVDVKSSQSVDAIANGSVDAIIYYQPYAYEIKDWLGDNGITWPAQSGQLSYAVIACQNDWIASHPKAIIRFLKSLDQAEEYIINHPDEAKAIIQKRPHYDDAYMASIWPDQQFSLSLDQSLLIAMNDEGRWMIKNNLTTEKTLPYFRDYIYTKSLEEVKPEALNIR